MTPAAALRRHGRRVALALVVALLAAGCGGGSRTDAGAGANSRLSGTCPATVVVQLPWTPQAEQGAFYHMVGAGYSVDADRRSVTGPLMAGGTDTGVNIELRSGGPRADIQSVAGQMYDDPSIMLGQVSIDDAIGLSPKQPVMAVMAPFEKAPYMIQWDPKQHPDFHAISDIGKSRTTVVYAAGSTYMEFLIGTGKLRRDQIDGSYDGSPARWLADGGKIAQQGLVTSDPYLYEKALAQWKKPVEFELIHDAGYQVYADTVVVRADRKAVHATCLKKLVPMIQRSLAEFVKNPGDTIDLIIKANEAYKGPAYSAEQARFSVDQQRRLGIVSNGPDATIGDFDDRRVWAIMDMMTPIFAGQHRPIKPGLTATDLYTNEFLDKSIGLD